MTEIVASLELTKVEVDTLYFILRRIAGHGKGRSAAWRMLRAVERLNPCEPMTLRAGNPSPAPIDVRQPGTSIFLYEKSPEHMMRSLRRVSALLNNPQLGNSP